MSCQFETFHISHQLTTGIGYPYCFGLGEKIIRGSVYLDGPSITGDENTFKTVEASVMIGPCNNEDSPIPKVCDGTIFYPQWAVNPCGVSGIGNEKGVPLYDPYSLVVRAGPHLTRNVSCTPDGAGPGPTIVTPSKSAALFIGDVDIHGTVRMNEKLSVKDKADFRNDVVVSSNVIVGGSVIAGTHVLAQGEVISRFGGAQHILSLKKNFDIKHPTKNGWRLRHTCPESPSNDVFIRGRVKNQTEIELPKYWKNLVDHDTITVNLTPIGAHQDVIVKRWDESKVYLQSRGGMLIDCFYQIFAERKDGEKLIPEYPGETPNDYPGNNDEYSVVGWDYDVRK